MVAITARFRVLCVLLLIEIRSRRFVHFNVTEHPTADWTLQQFREAVPSVPPLLRSTKRDSAACIVEISDEIENS